MKGIPATQCYPRLCRSRAEPDKGRTHTTCGASIVLRVQFGQTAEEVLVGTPHLIPVRQVLIGVKPLVHLHQCARLLDGNDIQPCQSLAVQLPKSNSRGVHNSNDMESGHQRQCMEASGRAITWQHQHNYEPASPFEQPPEDSWV